MTPAKECGYRQRSPCQHQRRARGGAGEKFLHDTEVALPYDIDAVKNGHEKNALRQNAGSNEVQIGNIACVHHSAA